MARNDRQPLNDPRIREALVAELAKRHPFSLLLNEMQLRGRRVIADVVTIDHGLSAYEIKSDLDDLTRLVRQATYYTRTCDFITLVTTRPQHEAAIPAHWGLVLASLSSSGNVDLTWVREAQRNLLARTVDLLYVLRGTELGRILRANGQRGIALMPKGALVERVYDLLGEGAARAVALEVLRTRKTWSIRQLGVADDDARLRHAVSQPAPQLTVLTGALF